MMWGSGAVLCHAGLGNKNHSPCWTDWDLTVVFPQLPSVIATAEKQNGPFVRNTAGLQGVEQPANLLIHQSDSVEVLASRLAETLDSLKPTSSDGTAISAH